MRNVFDQQVTWFHLIAGPIVSALANKFGCRIVAVIGSVIGGIFFVVSQWSTNIDMMIVTYGVMGGK
jgi:MCP family monocarboxylic acid transporter-like MFS transporter 14